MKFLGVHNLHPQWLKKVMIARVVFFFRRNCKCPFSAKIIKSSWRALWVCGGAWLSRSVFPPFRCCCHQRVFCPLEVDLDLWKRSTSTRLADYSSRANSSSKLESMTDEGFTEELPVLTLIRRARNSFKEKFFDRGLFSTIWAWFSQMWHWL